MNGHHGGGAMKRLIVLVALAGCGPGNGGNGGSGGGDMAMAPPVTITGMVLDEGGGTPLGGAGVLALDGTSLNSLAAATAGADGSYSLMVPPNGIIFLRATAMSTISYIAYQQGLVPTANTTVQFHEMIP